MYKNTFSHKAAVMLLKEGVAITHNEWGCYDRLEPLENSEGKYTKAKAVSESFGEVPKSLKQIAPYFMESETERFAPDFQKGYYQYR
jgi:hypothetical protein